MTPTPARYPVALAVACDAAGCRERFHGYFLVDDNDDRDVRLGYVLDHVARHERWQVEGRERPETATTRCPRHASGETHAATT